MSHRRHASRVFVLEFEQLDTLAAVYNAKRGRVAIYDTDYVTDAGQLFAEERETPEGIGSTSRLICE